ncbi:MAG TPA: class I SAM-dependent methyltransferase [Terracidiphilus sp.]|jgi:SAM-dependent methyltransferase
MEEKVLSFYSSLADYYHLIFEDWDASIARQASILNPLIASEIPGHPLRILDCACGIGTQALGFAAFGHQVTGSDLSPASISRAVREAELRNLPIACQVADMTSLDGIDSGFDVVAALDNALPHLSSEQLPRALQAIASRLGSGGLFLASIRDYDELILSRPSMQPPAFYGKAQNRRIIHQVWDWIDERTYTLHLFITAQQGSAWTSHHFISEYHCLLRDELSAALRSAGFDRVKWLIPRESGYYQPLVLARKTPAAEPRSSI